MLLVNLDRDSSEPLFRQFVAGIAHLVDEGSLRPGERLPPSRTLAEDLGVHRSTVVRAYRELGALGYLDSRSGAYSTVRRRARALVTGPAPEAPFDFWPLTTLGEAELCARLLDAGVRVTPGFLEPPATPHLRLSTAVEGEGRIALGCRRLGEVLAAGR